MLTSILILAALFAVFTFIRPRAGCGGHCGLCAKSCGSAESHHD
jgi:hypothetical protein